MSRIESGLREVFDEYDREAPDTDLAFERARREARARTSDGGPPPHRASRVAAVGVLVAADVLIAVVGTVLHVTWVIAVFVPLVAAAVAAVCLPAVWREGESPPPSSAQAVKEGVGGRHAFVGCMSGRTHTPS